MSTTTCETGGNANLCMPWNMRNIADFYDVSIRTVQRWIRCGQLPPPFKMGKKRLWIPQHVMEFMEQRSREAQTTLAVQNLGNFIAPIKPRRRNNYGT